ncbi:MAG: DUF2064 domain-containing protein [Wenzhouxiangellaceae bacterium]|nr:DUF2064 domain-containing protein [Wenzhouxiangellaceae bacterium]
MKPAVAIFVKTPGFSPIKTRLARRLGIALAENWHSNAAACVAQSARQSGLEVYWAVAEVEALSDPLWQDLPRIAQTQGSLGERMAGVHTRLVERHGSAILVGADLPQLQAHHLRQAADWLDADSSRQVIGPAHDGGFWLFGANRVFDTQCWASVTYSRSDTARQFINAMAGDAWEMLARLTDLDEPEDLPRVLAELQAVPQPTISQQKMIDWLKECIEQAA